MQTGCSLALALLCALAQSARSQPVPGVPAAPAAAGGPAAVATAGPGGVATAAAPGAAPNNIWSFLCMTPEQKAAKKDKFCSSPLGQLINNSLAPASALTGGVLGGCCPPVSPKDLAQPP